MSQSANESQTSDNSNNRVPPARLFDWYLKMIETVEFEVKRGDEQHERMLQLNMVVVAGWTTIFAFMLNEGRWWLIPAEILVACLGIRLCEYWWKVMEARWSLQKRWLRSAAYVELNDDFSSVSGAKKQGQGNGGGKELALLAWGGEAEIEKSWGASAEGTTLKAQKEVISGFIAAYFIMSFGFGWILKKIDPSKLQEFAQQNCRSLN